jgi:hypothetical protein
MLQLLLALGSGHNHGRLAAAATAAVRLPAAGQPQGAGPLAGAGLRALEGATLAAAPSLTHLFSIFKLSCQLSKAQA